ncbi:MULTISPECIES: MBL fold metallo-hydrolase [Hyphobacterium]|uniref:MBL fold metallo-hydrolase n=1 Tax=Hyphobacterium vulgare TaxID=1736751 RepID=A0ABV6ZWZ1_9PROT
MRHLILATALATATVSASFAQEAPQLTFTATELNGGIVMLDTGMAGNLAVLPGPDGVLLVDDQLPGTGPQVEAAIAGHAEEGVPRFILNTHWHGDHTGSNAHFAAQGTTVVAHDNIRVRLAASEDEWTQDPNVLPLLTFGQDITFHMNGQTIEVTHVPNAHTDGDAFAYFREADVLHMGDVMFNQRFPFIDLTAGGSVDGYLAAMERALEIAGPDTQIIPGHGPLATRQDVENSIAMLRTARELVRTEVEAELTLEEVLAADPLAGLTEAWSWRFICTPRMTAILYYDLTGAAERWPADMRCG